MHESMIFLTARKLGLPERYNYLDQVCGKDSSLRSDVEELLAADDGVEQPTSRTEFRHTEIIRIEQGMLFAQRYRLLEKIGEGGMGVVYRADQLEPVMRQVAVKIIRSPLASPTTVARFEQESQTLALMDHPHIAKVLDAGLASLSSDPNAIRSPYFVMEYIQGVPVTTYCAHRRFSLRQKLETMIPVCQAIQHAHQKGIIHRDLKPSNILVSTHDGKPLVKVIDFGVAKPVAGHWDEEKRSTESGALLGTLEYMSPEQADLGAIDIDTRTDIYSLGVILYELLTGSVPFNRQEWRKSGLGEMLRIIQQVEPPKPSTRLSHSSSVASNENNHRNDSRRLTRIVQGDLDCIVMKAMEKDRTRRYETVEGLALDINRYLADEPLLARPPTAGYRLGKLLRRHRGKLIAASLVALSLLGGLIGTIWGLVRSIEQGERAELKAREASWIAADERAARQLANENAEKARVNEQEAQRQEQLALAVRDFFLNDVIRLAGSVQQIRRQQKPNPDITIKQALHQAASAIDGKFQGEEATMLAVRAAMAESLMAVGDYRTALLQIEKVISLREKLDGPHHKRTKQARQWLLDCLIHLKDYDRVVASLAPGGDAEVEQLAKSKKLSMKELGLLATALEKKGQHDHAITLWQHVHRSNAKRLGVEHVETLSALHCQGVAFIAAKRYSEARPLLEQAVAGNEKVHGIEHPYTLQSLSVLGSCLTFQNEFVEAIKLLERTHATQVKVLGEEHPHTLSTASKLAGCYFETEQVERAIPLQLATVNRSSEKLGVQDASTQTAMMRLIDCYRYTAQYDEAITFQTQLLDVLLVKWGANHLEALKAQAELGQLFSLAGRAELALDILRKVADKCRDMPVTPQRESIVICCIDGFQRAKQFSHAEKLLRQRLQQETSCHGTSSQPVALALVALGQHQLLTEEWDAAEKTLRESILILESPTVGKPGWQLAEARSLLGAAVAGRKDYAAAEPLLVQAQVQLQQQRRTIPLRLRQQKVAEATQRLASLYCSMSKPNSPASGK